MYIQGSVPFRGGQKVPWALHRIPADVSADVCADASADISADVSADVSADISNAVIYLPKYICREISDIINISAIICKYIHML